MQDGQSEEEKITGTTYIVESKNIVTLIVEVWMWINGTDTPKVAIRYPNFYRLYQSTQPAEGASFSPAATFCVFRNSCNSCGI